MCCWWTHRQGHLMNIWQCWRTLKNTAVWMEPFWSPHHRYPQVWRNITIQNRNKVACDIVKVYVHKKVNKFCFLYYLWSCWCIFTANSLVLFLSYLHAVDKHYIVMFKYLHKMNYFNKHACSGLVLAKGSVHGGCKTRDNLL